MKDLKKMLNNSCIICYDKLKNPILEPLCQTLFCGDCLLKWLKTNNNCPTCRRTIIAHNLVYVSRNKIVNTVESYNTKPITKLCKIVQLINNKTEGKFLIYSSYDETFKPICNILTENNISFVILKGSVNNRQYILDNYKNGTIKVIFLNSNFNSAGLNLQETTDIILYHNMLSSTQLQIIGRAERIGRQNNLHVHHLVVDI